MYTPRGLKIRIPVPCAFGLMARLYPQVSAFRVLKTTEGLDHIPGVLSFLAAILAFLGNGSSAGVTLAIAGACFLGTVVNAIGLVVPGLVHIGTAASYITGYGLFNLAAIAVGAITMGWRGPVAYIVGKVAGCLAAQVVEWWQCKRLYRLTGLNLTASEQCFFNAYRLYASRLGITTNVELADAEIRPESWRPCYADLAEKWPAVVSRFAQD